MQVSLHFEAKTIPQIAFKSIPEPFHCTVLEAQDEEEVQFRDDPRRLKPETKNCKKQRAHVIIRCILQHQK